jgi:uncharacterized protein YggE
MKSPLLAGVLALSAVASVASAQQADKLAAGVATAMEGFGQSVGESAVSGSSVFVTATGRAPWPATARTWYSTTVDVHDASAVEAARARDGRVAAIEAAARRYGVVTERQSSSFALDSGVTRSKSAMVMSALAAAPGSSGGLPAVAVAPPKAPAEPPAPRFTAKTTLRFSATDPDRFPEFLDAIRALGVEAISGGPTASNPLSFLQNSSLFGQGVVDKVDDAVWDRASQAAMAEARRQASVLAAAGGRALGEVRQVTALTRDVQGGEASVTLAVRFGFAPAK